MPEFTHEGEPQTRKHLDDQGLKASPFQMGQTLTWNTPERVVFHASEDGEDGIVDIDELVRHTPDVLENSVEVAPSVGSDADGTAAAGENGDLPKSSRLGRFEIQRVLGRGGLVPSTWPSTLNCNGKWH